MPYIYLINFEILTETSWVEAAWNTAESFRVWFCWFCLHKASAV